MNIRSKVGATALAIACLLGLAQASYANEERDHAQLTFAEAQSVAPNFVGVSNWLNSGPLSIADLRGKVVVVLANDPDFEADRDLGFEGRRMVLAGRIGSKFEAAARAGALGVLVIHEDAHRIGVPVRAPKGGRPPVGGHVAAEGKVGHRRFTDSRTMLPSMNAMLAGRSARRRMR